MHLNPNTLFVTGGAGFIGSALIRLLLQERDVAVINIDKLTYAGSLTSLQTVAAHPRHIFVRQDIGNCAAIDALLRQYRPRAIVHLAAESHVDRSIDRPAAFIDTNIIGTYTLLEAARDYWSRLPESEQNRFRFHHVSTDEVFGSLHDADSRFNENSPHAPNNPYSASKAASNHLVRAGIRDVLPIATPQKMLRFQNLLGDGSSFGISLNYAVQAQPQGIAQAFLIGESFIGSDSVCLILGDNLFHGKGLNEQLNQAVNQSHSATIFAHQVLTLKFSIYNKLLT
ncbi:MAG: GDP-mannose 4,6-dehydratase [Neisseria sp.]|nr:GDP-mannose 4,6-dehydratase [Neisseria sp.]